MQQKKSKKVWKNEIRNPRITKDILKIVDERGKCKTRVDGNREIRYDI